jgi:hypothetical protein
VLPSTTVGFCLPPIALAAVGSTEIPPDMTTDGSTVLAMADDCVGATAMLPSTVVGFCLPPIALEAVGERVRLPRTRFGPDELETA